MMKRFVSHENDTAASANYAEASSACAAMSNASENVNMLIMGAIIMASIIIFRISRISISLLVLAILVLLGVLVIREKVNTPKGWM